MPLELQLTKNILAPSSSSGHPGRVHLVAAHTWLRTGMLITRFWHFLHLILTITLHLVHISPILSHTCSFLIHWNYSMGGAIILPYNFCKGRELTSDNDKIHKMTKLATVHVTVATFHVHQLTLTSSLSRHSSLTQLYTWWCHSRLRHLSLAIQLRLSCTHDDVIELYASGQCANSFSLPVDQAKRDKSPPTAPFAPPKQLTKCNSDGWYMTQTLQNKWHIPTEVRHSPF